MVNLSLIKTNSPKNVCAIDASTNSIAFSVFHGKDLAYFGKVNFEGKTAYEKVIDASRKLKEFFNLYGDFDSIVIEHTVFINSPKTAADLALVQGAILGAAAINGVTRIGSVSPMTWQNFIGNKRLTPMEKQEILKDNPGKSTSWLKSQEREIRKQRTIRFVNVQYDKTTTDNDIADAIAIGHWTVNNIEKAFG
jgi:Holliday junction resolvasome RuvABC endonuclease subunit